MQLQYFFLKRKTGSRNTNWTLHHEFKRVQKSYFLSEDFVSSFLVQNFKFFFSLFLRCKIIFMFFNWQFTNKDVRPIIFSSSYKKYKMLWLVVYALLAKHFIYYLILSTWFLELLLGIYRLIYYIVFIICMIRLLGN